MYFDESLLKLVPARVIPWFSENARPLPWRGDGATPYHVWLSEIMLQQTRIEAVVPYYERFLRAFPTVSDLANAPEDSLMKNWEGLGYYSRARNLGRAAAKIMSDFGGELPAAVPALLTLPGIGAYTAGAIASIAYGQPEPAVDGNVLRVLMRLFACSDDIADPHTKDAVTAALKSVYPSGGGAKALTQGLMEIGEVACIPNGAPLCEKCPLSDVCLARAAGACDAYPVKSPKKPRRIEEKTVLLLTDGKRFVTRKRPKSGLLAGLYEFPNCDGHLTAEEVASLPELALLHPTKILPLPDAKHIFTHVEWHMTGYLVTCDALPADAATPEEIESSRAIPSAFRAYKTKMKEER